MMLKFRRNRSHRRAQTVDVGDIGFSSPLQSHLFDSREQRRRLHTQKFGSSVGSLDFPVGLFEDNEQIVPFPPQHLGLGEEFGRGRFFIDGNDDF